MVCMCVSMVCMCVSMACMCVSMVFKSHQTRQGPHADFCLLQRHLFVSMLVHGMRLPTDPQPIFHPCVQKKECACARIICVLCLQIPSPSGIANLAWAFLSLGQRAPAMLAALARAAVVQKVCARVCICVHALAVCGQARSR